jgi:hypothetical protein
MNSDLVYFRKYIYHLYFQEATIIHILKNNQWTTSIHILKNNQWTREFSVLKERFSYTLMILSLNF